MTFAAFESALTTDLSTHGDGSVHLGVFAPTTDSLATASYRLNADTVRVDASGTDYSAEYYPERFYDLLSSAYRVPSTLSERADRLLRLRAEHNRASASAPTVE